LLIKIQFSGQIFEKSSNVKFHEKPSSDSPVFPFVQTNRWTYRHDLIIIRSSQFCEKNLKTSACTDAITGEIYWKSYEIEETKRLGPTPALFLHINGVIFKWAHEDCASAASSGELGAALFLEEGGVAPG